MQEGELFFGLNGPLDAVPGDGQCRAANFAGLQDYANAQGRDARRILERHGIEPRVIGDPESHVPCQSIADTFEYCSTLFDDPLFGLHLGNMQDQDVFGCVTALCRAAPTMRDAVECVVDYLPVVHSPEASVELVEGPHVAELRWGANIDLGVNDQAHLQAMMLNLKLLRMIGGPGFDPSYVNLSVETRARDMEEIEQIAACRVHARANINAIGFPAQALDRPIASANRLLFRLLGGYLARLKQANSATIVARAGSYIRGALPTGSCSIERCAQKLGFSVRTLQGRLAAHGVKFSDLVEGERERLARIYLQTPSMSLEEVAERLGYGEQTSFGRAFKRWTGVTPQRFRTAH
ncbi:MAG TPA: AraC family transcriptional regulator ligand-binding domain-containing protein [Sphingobium sp.]|uniref:helix-turn-helix transcriptional regulator n=1 Tax=Sphingobium sp. TaxID=1912891 RepID=UPI002ED48915